MIRNATTDILKLTSRGLYCAAGDFFIDPWPSADAPAELSIITHGHADHARPHSQRYIATAPTAAVMHSRMDAELNITSWPYGVQHQLGDATVSLHSAGHVLGSAQVRVEVEGRVWVVSGDYKRDPDPTCAPFQVVPCDVFITEATFALPAYRWRPAAEVVASMADWWAENAAKGKTSVLFCYSFGKAQRILAELSQLTADTVYLHGAMQRLVALYREFNVGMVPTQLVSDAAKDADFSKSLIVAPPSAAGSPWMRRFKNHSTGFVSGWMRVRGNRRRRGYDRGFVISDHADWPSLLATIRDTGARRVLATHGKTDILVRYLQEQGVDAQGLQTQFDGSGEETAEPANLVEPARVVATPGAAE